MENGKSFIGIKLKYERFTRVHKSPQQRAEKRLKCKKFESWTISWRYEYDLKRIRIMQFPPTTRSDLKCGARETAQRKSQKRTLHKLVWNQEQNEL